MKIYITAENIEQGKPSCDETCALALAFKDAGFCASVGDDSVDLWPAAADEVDRFGFRPTRCYYLPDELIRFVSSFDDKQPIEPMEFDFSDLLTYAEHEQAQKDLTS